MQKTRQPLYLPLSMQARKWMPERDGADEEDAVFSTLPCEDSCNVLIKSWVKEAGITKHVSYHTLNHTSIYSLLKINILHYVFNKQVTI